MLASHSDFGQVEPYQQIQNYSCGAAALKAVMQHWGENVDEPTLIREIGVDPKHGSTAQQVTNAARARGYLAQTRRFDSIDELGKYTSKDVPVIVAIRSFTRPNQGHFVVATKVKPATIDIMDPNVRGNQRTLSRGEMDARWEFRDRIGVIVVPKRKRTQLAADASTTAASFPPLSTGRKVAVAAAIVASIAATAVAIVVWRRQHAVR